MLWRVFLSFVFLTCPAFAAPQVVASIKPLHALVAGVMAGVGTPDVLIGGGASVHSYSMRPSEAHLLENAVIVFWIGPAFETFLDKPLATIGHGQIVALMKAPGVRVLPAREGGLWESHEDHAHGPSDQEADGHIWLDPENAKAMVAHIAATLSANDPVNATAYAANAAALTARLTVLADEVKVTLAPVRDKPFIVFHDAYQYFERSFGLKAVGSITVAADRPPGAKRIGAIREKIVTQGAACVFAEPQFEPRLVRTVTEGTKARTGTLDPEGSTLPAGAENYFVLMRGLAANLAACLKG